MALGIRMGLPVYVDPGFQRLGVGRALLDHALAHLRALGCTTAVLHASDAGVRLYERAGFAPVKEMRLALAEGRPPGLD